VINQSLNKISIHFIKYRYVYLLAIICLAQIVLTPQTELIRYNSSHDVIAYRQMAIAFPSIDSSVGKPFAYRLLAPWLAGLLFKDVDVGFTVLNAIFSLCFVVILYNFLKQNQISDKIAFFISAAFVLNRYFIPNFAFEPYRFCDVLSNVLLLLTLIYLAKNKYLPVYVLSFLGILTKENALLIIPVGIIFIYLNNKNKIASFSVFSFLLFTIFISIRILIPVEQGISLLQAFDENWSKIFSIEAIAKQFFLAFNPFYLIPIVTYKDFIDFNKKNFHWFVLLFFVLISSLFGGDKERLMFAYIPIYYLFIAGLFEKIQMKSQLKTLTLFLILILCWTVNLNHIWGIILLPSRESSLAFALAGGIIMLMIYLSIQKNEDSQSDFRL
jgi:hypothetical protein